MPRIFAIGFGGRHQVPAFWSNNARRHRAEAIFLGKRNFAGIGPGSLVLLNWALDHYENDMNLLLDKGALVSAHLQPGKEVHAREVITCIPRGLKDCWCERLPADAYSPDYENELTRRMDNMLSHGRPFGPIALEHPRRKGAKLSPPRKVFLASPFANSLYQPFREGVAEALKPLGIEVLNPGDVNGNATVNTDVTGAIDNCDAVIANLRNRDPNDHLSCCANVWFEIGYAYKAGKPVVLCRFADDRFEMPSDISGRKYLTYCDSIHLALQLFYGFGGQ